VGDFFLVKAEQNRLHPWRMVVPVDPYVIGPHGRLLNLMWFRHAGESRQAGPIPLCVALVISSTSGSLGQPVGVVSEELEAEVVASHDTNRDPSWPSWRRGWRALSGGA
jgi:hypothetical protein